jgi:hypothetical protein
VALVQLVLEQMVQVVAVLVLQEMELRHQEQPLAQVDLVAAVVVL